MEIKVIQRLPLYSAKPSVVQVMVFGDRERDLENERETEVRLESVDEKYLGRAVGRVKADRYRDGKRKI
jgi:hypothetical protein